MVPLAGRSLGYGARLARVVLGVALPALALGLLLVTNGAAASTPAASSASFFSVSPLEALPLAGGSATRYSVSLSHVPANNAPSYLWSLHLSGPGPACADSVLPGGQRVSGSEVVWANQGPRFVWYHGAKGTYPADRSYGCAQATLGVGGYPGTVTVVIENEYQRCVARFAAGPATTATRGAPASCALGGYSLTPSTLPVPAKLLQLYASLSGGLSGLRERVSRGSLQGGALEAALSSLLGRQQAAFAQLFPPLWGCSFATLFADVIGTSAALRQQLAGLASGARPPDASFAHDAQALRTLEASLEACGRSATPGGDTPRSVLAAATRLATAGARLRTQAGRSSGSLAALETGLPGLASGLDAIVARFPTVFGMPFKALVARTLAEDAAARVAEHAAASHNRAGTLSALSAVLAPTETIGVALRVHAKRVIRLENAKA